MGRKGVGGLVSKLLGANPKGDHGVNSGAKGSDLDSALRVGAGLNAYGGSGGDINVGIGGNGGAPGLQCHVENGMKICTHVET